MTLGVTLAVFLILFVAGPAAASEATPGVPDQPGNYCVSCHLPEDERLDSATAWNGDIEREATSPCPAARRIREELNYTERLLLGISNAREGLPGYVDTGPVDDRLASTMQSYSRLVDRPVSSLDAFIAEAQVLRFQLNKSYTQLNNLNEAVKKDRILAGAGFVTLALLASLLWGLRNTRHALLKFPAVTGNKILPIGAPVGRAALFGAAIFGFFMLPIFRVLPQPVEEPTLEEQAFQTRLDEAQRAAQAADRSLARAWMLARIGAAWQQSDPSQADLALEEALLAAREAGENAAGLWGKAQAALEASAGEETSLEKALLASSQLAATQSRAWELRLIAEEWIPVDRDRAGQLLDEALVVAQSARPPYDDLDRRSIAVTWARFDVEKAVEVAGLVQDPGLRSWALREIAALSERADLFDQAADAARMVTDPIQRSRLLIEAGKASGDTSLFAEARTALSEVSGYAQAYGLSDLAAASGDTSLLDALDAYPAARAAALARLGQFEAAWQAAGEMDDAYERARAQAAIAGAWAAVDVPAAAEASSLIEVPEFRDRALRDVIRASGDSSLVANLDSAYYRVQALTSLGEYEQAWNAAQDTGDRYPLVELGIVLAETDPQTALTIVDAMDREADKAMVLIALAAAHPEQSLFERALGMALAARVRGDALAPAEASLALARALEGRDAEKAAAFEQALSTAQRIPIQ